MKAHTRTHTQTLAYARVKTAETHICASGKVIFTWIELQAKQIISWGWLHAPKRLQRNTLTANKTNANSVFPLFFFLCVCVYFLVGFAIHLHGMGWDQSYELWWWYENCIRFLTFWANNIYKMTFLMQTIISFHHAMFALHNVWKLYLNNVKNFKFSYLNYFRCH